MSYVLLQCVKEKSKLRVKMISSSPFIKGANCQFPRDIRQEGMYYVVKTEGVKLKGKFYSVMKKDIVVCQTYDINKIKEYIHTISLELNMVIPTKIFGEDEDSECIICMVNEKDSVFSPCGHYMTCHECSVKCKECPICRDKFVTILKRSDIHN